MSAAANACSLAPHPDRSQIPHLPTKIQYIDDLTRRLSTMAGTSEGEMLRHLRNLNLPDEFWLYGLKVTPCTKPYSHKWSLCPCGHAGETGRRRDPRTHPYKATMCPLTKAKRVCPLGDNCMWSHNIFEHWLHPDRYKTRLCTFASSCNRAICFFAHSPEELRNVPNSDENKEKEERDYLMQLMTARGDSSSNAPMAQPQQAIGKNGLMADMPFRSSGANSRHISPHTATHSPPLRQARTLSGNFFHQHHDQLLTRDQSMMGGPPIMGIPMEHSCPQLMGLDAYSSGGLEPLNPYGVNNPLDGNGWPMSSPNPPVRLSDPGEMPHMLLSSVLNPVPHLNRNSDSGQAFGMAAQLSNSFTDASIESFISSLSVPQGGGGRALGGSNSPTMPTHSLPLPNPQARMSYPDSRPSSGISPNSSPQQTLADEQLLQMQLQLQQLRELQEQIAEQQAQEQTSRHLQRSSSSPTSKTVDNLVAQLQDQGLGSTKGEVVASLSSLLAQLLSAP